MGGERVNRGGESDISYTGEELLTDAELEIESFAGAKGDREGRRGKKRGRPLGAKNKRQREVAKQSGKRLEDFVEIFGRKDRIKRSPARIKEGKSITGKTVQTRSTETGEEREEAGTEKRKNGKREERTEEDEGQSEEEGEGQSSIMEFLKSQGRNLEENLKRLKEEMMEGIRAGNAATRELLTSEITELRKELDRKEKEWQVERKIMQVRIGKLEDKVTALEAKTEKKKMDDQVRAEIEKRLGEEGMGIPEKQREEKWLRKLEEKVEKMVRVKDKEEEKRLESIDMMLERNERTRRRVNLIIRGMEFEGRNLRKLKSF